MAEWKKIITSGSNAELNHITSSGEIGYRTAATLKGDIGGTAASSTFTDVTIDGAGGLELKNGSTGPGFIKFFEDSDNGTNAITLIGPASTADATLTLPSTAGTLLTEFTVAATTNTNPSTITQGDTLTIAASTVAVVELLKQDYSIGISAAISWLVLVIASKRIFK